MAESKDSKGKPKKQKLKRSRKDQENEDSVSVKRPKKAKDTNISSVKNEKKSSKKLGSASKTGKNINEIKVSDNILAKSNEQLTEEVDLLKTDTENKAVDKPARPKKKRKSRKIKALPDPEPGAFEAMLVKPMMKETESNDGKVQTNVATHLDDDATEKKTLTERKTPKKPKRKKDTVNLVVMDNNEVQDETKISAKDLALEYLDTWKKTRNNWSFKKVRQVWLLHHLYDDSAISENHFDILLEYLQGAKGAAKTKTVEDAEKMFEEVETSTEEKGDISMLKQARARKIIQHLST